jgi:hypothetical protein
LGGERVGGHRQIIWGGKSKDPLVDHFTHNNQPKTDTHNGEEYGEDVRLGSRRGQNAIATFGDIKI